MVSREKAMLQGRREVRLLRLSLVRPAAPNTYRGSAGCPCQGTPTATKTSRQSQSADGGTKVCRRLLLLSAGCPRRVPETSPCPLSAVQGERADLGERIGGVVAAGSRVAQLGVGSKGGPPSQSSLRTPSNRDFEASRIAGGVGQLVIRKPRTPYGRPIKAIEVGSFPHFWPLPEGRGSKCGRRTEALRDRRSGTLETCPTGRPKIRV